MNNIQTYTDHITPYVDHTYYCKATGRVNGVSNIVDKKTIKNKIEENNFSSPATNSGKLCHDYIDNYLHSKDKNLEKAAKRKAICNELYDTMNDIEKSRVNQLTAYIEKENIKIIRSELPFIAVDEQVKFGGTLDASTSTTVFDWKFGALSNTYKFKTSAYTAGTQKLDAVITYYNKNNQLQIFHLSRAQVASNYNSFKQIYNNLASTQLTMLHEEILSKLQWLEQATNHIEEMKLIIEEAKQSVYTDVENMNMTKFDIDKFCITKFKDSEAMFMPKETLEKLKQSNPELFKKRFTKGSFRITGLSK